MPFVKSFRLSGSYCPSTQASMLNAAGFTSLYLSATTRPLLSISHGQSMLAGEMEQGRGRRGGATCKGGHWLTAPGGSAARATRSTKCDTHPVPVGSSFQCACVNLLPRQSSRTRRALPLRAWLAKLLHRILGKSNATVPGAEKKEEVSSLSLDQESEFF
ncbi:hypothetical protein BS78_05G023200 [Paspalum vaginatum]|nr:hypothetical protein BS78_05G023200 [Paspalum vaginatum]